MSNSVYNAYESLTGNPDALVFLTCEHASERLPAPWVWTTEDERWLGTHWALDLGAAELTEELAAALGAPAVLARFSRLLIDPNRDERDDTLFQREVEGVDIALNRTLDDEERARRLAECYRPYHDAIDQGLAVYRSEIILAIHTFTPVYKNTPRAFEVGILFDREERLATEIADAIAAAGFQVALNEPYSGREGMIFSADLHASRQSCQALEIEMRQDLAVTPEARARLIAAVVPRLRGQRS